MSAWRVSERDTDELRATIDCPPDACVYRNDAGLMAVLYVQVGHTYTMWHLYLSGKHRMPAIEEMLDAREQLLPGIDSWTIEAPVEHIHNCVHMVEVPEEIHATRQ